MKKNLSKSFYEARALSNTHTYNIPIQRKKLIIFAHIGKPRFQTKFRSDPTAIWKKIQIFENCTCTVMGIIL